MSDPAILNERYEVIRPLGRGAFAHTLLARDRRLGRPVALKVLHPRQAADHKAYELFEREAAVLRELRHPAIPLIHSTFRAPWDGAEAAFLVMEYIEGTPLAELIAARRHFDQAEVLNLFVELLGVLDYLHSRVPPVLHRDIKPANLIVRPDGSPALVDFGAVRNVFRAPDEDGSTIVGTHGYMPYEQYMGQASPASDLYALGATLLHLVTGRAPPDFMGEAGRLEVPAGLPEPLRAVLVRMLAPAPADRFQSAREVRAALLGVAVQQAKRGALVPGESESAALATRDTETGVPVPRYRSQPLELAPPPRELRGETRRLYKEVCYSPLMLMTTSERGKGSAGVLDWFFLVFFSVITAGILPAIFVSFYAGRRRRYKPFLIRGLPAEARVLDMTQEKTAFDEKLTRVRYEFEADGMRHRGSDQVLPAIAERWDPGDTIQILYLPEQDYDSVIISTS
ncbi:MAG: serine/threonine protein kinase [Gemmatimonadales bacterium]